LFAIFRADDLRSRFEKSCLNEWVVFSTFLERPVRFDERFVDEDAVQFISQKEVYASTKSFVPPYFVALEMSHGGPRSGDIQSTEHIQKKRERQHKVS
jgi:hypothetical protein